jgi:hypothetical protein
MEGPRYYAGLSFLLLKIKSYISLLNIKSIFGFLIVMLGVIKMMSFIKKFALFSVLCFCVGGASGAPNIDVSGELTAFNGRLSRLRRLRDNGTMSQYEFLDRLRKATICMALVEYTYDPANGLVCETASFVDARDCLKIHCFCEEEACFGNLSMMHDGITGLFNGYDSKKILFAINSYEDGFFCVYTIYSKDGVAIKTVTFDGVRDRIRDKGRYGAAMFFNQVFMPLISDKEGIKRLKSFLSSMTDGGATFRFSKEDFEAFGL